MPVNLSDFILVSKTDWSGFTDSLNALAERVTWLEESSRQDRDVILDNKSLIASVKDQIVSVKADHANLVEEYNDLFLEHKALVQRVALLEAKHPPTTEPPTTEEPTTEAPTTETPTTLPPTTEEPTTTTEGPVTDPDNSVELLLFSDLTHGPNRGWSLAEPKKGAAVTVWHKDIGPRGSNYINVNEVPLVLDSDYVEWNVPSYDHPDLFRTTFHLNNDCQEGAGTIYLVKDNVLSNRLPFTVVEGGIKFVDLSATSQGDGSFESPFNRPGYDVLYEKRDSPNALAPGDVLYLREGTYSEKYLGGHQIFYMSGAAHGTKDRPIAMTSYPGETATILADGTNAAGSSHGVVNIKDYWTISKLRVDCLGYCIDLRGLGSRAVGNECIGMRKYAASAHIVTQGSQNDVLGNTCHGGRSRNKLDHGIYISGNASVERGTVAGYNYIYDNDFGIGPMFVINHQENRIPVGENCKRHLVSHNVIDCSLSGGRGIGIYHMSWEVGNPNNESEPEPAIIENNTIIGPSSNCLYQVNGSAVWRNNILTGGNGVGFLTGDIDVLDVDFYGNSIQMDSGNYLRVNSGSRSINIEGNTWSGLGDPPAQDTNPNPTKPSKPARIKTSDFKRVGGLRIDQDFPIGGLAIDFETGKVYSGGKAGSAQIHEYNLVDIGTSDDVYQWPILERTRTFDRFWGKGDPEGLAIQNGKLLVSARQYYDTSPGKLTISALDLSTELVEEIPTDLSQPAFGGGFWKGGEELLLGCGGYDSGQGAVSGPSVARFDGTKLIDPPHHGTMDFNARERRPANYSIGGDSWVGLVPRDIDGDGINEGAWAADRVYGGGIVHPKGVFTVAILGTGELDYNLQNETFSNTRESWLYSYDSETFDRNSVQFERWPNGGIIGYEVGPDGLIYLLRRYSWKGGYYKTEASIEVYQIQTGEQ